jgi:hypothetical protein
MQSLNEFLRMILLNYIKLYINKKYKYSHWETYINKLDNMKICVSGSFYLHIFSLTFS